METRQFRDGSVMECVPWSERPSDRWRVPAVAVVAAVQRACGGTVDVRVVATEFEEEALALTSAKSRERAMKERDGLRDAIQVCVCVCVSVSVSVCLCVCVSVCVSVCV